MEEPSSLEALKQQERMHLRKIRSLLWENRSLLDTTSQALYHSVMALAATSLVCKMMRLGQYTSLMLGSVAAGCVVHTYLALSKDVTRICLADSKLGNTLRLHYQHISYHSPLVPYFREATLKASASRSNSSQ